MIQDGIEGSKRSEIMPVKHISAVTLAVRSMRRSVEFYRRLGFEVVHGGEQSDFTSLRSGDAFVNLALSPSYQEHWWGRAVFRVENADAHFEALRSAGLQPATPRDAPWGERFFHVNDPDGHQLSFAALLPSQG